MNWISRPTKKSSYELSFNSENKLVLLEERVKQRHVLRHSFRHSFPLLSERENASLSFHVFRRFSLISVWYSHPFHERRKKERLSLSRFSVHRILHKVSRCYQQSHSLISNWKVTVESFRVKSFKSYLKRFTRIIKFIQIFAVELF